jgi:hypothetical protein
MGMQYHYSPISPSQHNMWRIVFLKLVQNYFSVGDGDSKVGYILKPEISMKCHSDGVETTCTTFWIPLLES